MENKSWQFYGKHPSRFRDDRILTYPKLQRSLARHIIAPPSGKLQMRTIANQHKITLFDSEPEYLEYLSLQEKWGREHIIGASSMLFEDGRAKSIDIQPELLRFAQIPREAKGVIVAASARKCAFTVQSLENWEKSSLELASFCEKDSKPGDLLLYSLDCAQWDSDWIRTHPPFSNRS